MLTISAIKADVGSVGGHTRPSSRMMDTARSELRGAVERNLILDADVTHCGDDICLLMVHRRGNDNADIHNFAWNVFEAATAIAQEEGLYGAGQDLLKDAPSGNVRGAGPGAAEISCDEAASERRAEPFLVFTADKYRTGGVQLSALDGIYQPTVQCGPHAAQREARLPFPRHRHGPCRRGQGDRTRRAGTTH